MSLPHRARTIRAEHEAAPAFAVLRLVQPGAYLGVLFSALQSYDSKSATLGLRVFDSFCYVEEPMSVAKKVRDVLDESETAASLLQDVIELLQALPKKARQIDVWPSEFRVHVSALVRPFGRIIASGVGKRVIPRSQVRARLDVDALRGRVAVPDHVRRSDESLRRPRVSLLQASYGHDCAWSYASGAPVAGCEQSRFGVADARVSRR